MPVTKFVDGYEIDFHSFALPRRRQWLGERLSATLHENAAVAPQDSRRLREVASAAQERYGLPVRPPRLPVVGECGGPYLITPLSMIANALLRVTRLTCFPNDGYEYICIFIAVKILVNDGGS